jgi:hypothetical protein
VPTAGADGTTAPSGPGAGFVPPNKPTFGCAIDYKTNPLTLINRCRKREGVGPMVLPSNYNSLPQPEQMLVVFNLERVNRGEAPVVGLNAALSSLAQAGANANSDPATPEGTFGGAVWATSQSALEADYEWMYNDGPGGISFDCHAAGQVGCWGHRDAILVNSDATDPLVGGTGWAANNYHGKGFTWNSYSAEFMYNYEPDQLTFAWSTELKNFGTAPAAEPIGPPKVTKVPKVNLSSGGGQTVTIKGANFFGKPTVAFDGVPATHVSCYGAATACDVVVPAHAAGTASVVVTTSEGSSAPLQVTYADPTLTRIGSATGNIKKGQCLYSVKVSSAVGGTPVAGLNVVFSVTSGPAEWQGGGTSFTRPTGGKGIAESVSLCDSKGQTGPVTVQASVPGLVTPVTWSFTIA